MLVVFLFVSILLNLLLVYLVLRKLYFLYGELKQRKSRRFQRRLSHFAMKVVENDQILFVGDSITEGVDWSTLFPRFAVRNFGIGSDTTAGLLERIDTIIAAHPKAIFLLIGTNDIGLNIPHPTILENYRRIVERIRGETPNTQLFVQSILPRHEKYSVEIVTLNQQLHSLAVSYDASYINLYSDFVNMEGGIKKTFSNDELHLLASGYRCWQEQLEPFMIELSL